MSGGPAEEEPTEFTLENYGDGSRDYREVVNELTDLGLVVTAEGEYSDDIAENMVIRTTPAAGSTVKEGDSITVYYSLGEEVTERSMPRLIGLTEADARNAISNMGLTMGSVSSEYNDDQPEGRVCYQSIPENSPVKEGDTVNIVINLGPEPEPEEPDTPDSSNGSNGSTGNGGTSEPTTQRYTITVTLPEGRTEDKLLIITVNGETHEETVSPDDTTYSIVYEGTIYSCTAEIDGTEYPFSIEANSST